MEGPLKISFIAEGCPSLNMLNEISFSFHFISFHIFMEGGPSVITDLQGAPPSTLYLHN